MNKDDDLESETRQQMGVRADAAVHLQLLLEALSDDRCRIGVHGRLVMIHLIGRAVEELLRETKRARVRAETMGPTGWLKCPIKSTNKRFLLNTIRSTALQRHPGGQSRARSPVERGRSEESGRERTGGTRHREGKERSHKRDSSREHSPSRRQSSHRHSHSSKGSSRKPYQSHRTRSRSPVHNRDTPSVVKQPSDE